MKAKKDSGIQNVAVTKNEIHLTMAFPKAGQYIVRELRPYEVSEHDSKPQGVTAWQGVGRGMKVIVLPRFEAKRDRLYAKWQLAAEGELIGAARYATDLLGIGARSQAFVWPKSIKGITCPVDLDDVIALGTKYLDTNVTLASALDFSNPSPTEFWEVDGEKFPINTRYFQELDGQFKKLTDAGINITLILNNPVPKMPDTNNIFIHPKTDLAHAPNHLGAFNLTNERSFRAYRAVLEYFADHYSRHDQKYGTVTGYIVGNEIQQHWEWYNLGNISEKEFLEEYIIALRTTYLAVQKAHQDMRVYVSMDHHWTASMKGDSQKEIRGDFILETLNAKSKSEGDFAWHVAFHPYPEDLFNPRFWKDKNATLAFDTPKITFKNLEVLPAFLEQKQMLCKGKPRRIILSEQGFHAANTPEGEELQAAAYAAAYYRVSQMPLIDAFILHRHVSHRDEGGLRLGLWTWDEKSADPSKPGRKLPIWAIFQQADTPNSKQVFAFAKPIIGIQNWKELDPKKRIARAALKPQSMPESLPVPRRVP